ncbi:MAG: ABC transporter ATP-binding protein [Deltaproteobacteria bacterium]|nr:MAG: ABC transporter ATP-binding protein [Deltaproteobacteria bacterium]
MNSRPVLKIENLRTFFYSKGKRAFVRSVDGVNLRIGKGETLGIVGESGSGKSVTALSIMGLVPGEPGVIIGKIGLKTDNIQKNLLQDLRDYVKINMSTGRIMEVYKDNVGWQKNVDRVMQGIRGTEIAMIFQNPKLALNPFIPIGKQITESIRINTPIKKRSQARERAMYWLAKVKMDSPRLRYYNNPYGLSGGMCQRAMIAMALSSDPSLLIADEPTTGLDATIQSKIVDLLADLKSSVGVTTMLISHDINVIKALSDNVAVMYGGTLLEHGPVGIILSAEHQAKHPYTAALLESIPREKHIREKGYLQAIKGDVLDTINIPLGCRFYSRCDKVTEKIQEKCDNHEPDLREISSGHSLRCWLYYE